jgi:hypothetical protein
VRFESSGGGDDVLSGIEPKTAAGDLVLLADHDRLARTDCYDFLQHDFAAMGEVALADIFSGLQEESQALLPSQLRHSGRGNLLSKPHGEASGVGCDATACRTTYDAWALAVNMEKEAETKLIELLSHAKDPRIKLLLMGRIRESYARAVAYRTHRRAAYHSERIGAVRAAFPDIRRIHDAVDLALVALAIERWFLRLLEMKTESAGAYAATSEMTRAAIARLERSTESHTVPRRLSKWLDALNKLPKAGDVVRGSDSFLNMQLVAEGGRVFDYYDSIFGNAEDEEILWFAQSLSRDAAARLKALRAARPD